MKPYHTFDMVRGAPGQIQASNAIVEGIRRPRRSRCASARAMRCSLHEEHASGIWGDGRVPTTQTQRHSGMCRWCALPTQNWHPKP